MIHKEFWGILFLVFVGWIFLPGQPNDRIAHACRPIGWTGNVVVSVSSLVLPNNQQVVQRWFDKFEYGCQYTTWRLIYQDDYNKEQAALKEAAAGGKPKAEKPAKVEKPEAPAGKVPPPPSQESER